MLDVFITTAAMQNIQIQARKFKMKKSLTIFITIALFFVSEKSNSQKYNWSKSFSSFADSLAPSAQGVATVGAFIETCSNGDLIVAGTFRGTMDADPSNETMYITSNGEYDDIFILRLTNNGEFVWVKQIGGEGWDGLSALKLDNQDNIFVAGYFSGSIDINPGPEINFIITNTSSNSFILKLNAAGEFTWEKHFLGNISGFNGEIQNWILFGSLEVSNNGDIMLVGQYRGTVNVNPSGSPFILTAQGLFDFLVLKIDSTGQFVYAFRVGSEGDDLYPLLIELLPNGSFLLVGGNNTSNVDIDPGPAEVTFTNRPFIGFYDSEAQLIWSQSLYTDFQPASEGARCVVYDLTKNSSGEFFLAGTSNNGFTVFDISGYPQTHSSEGGFSSFFIKMDSLGNKIWLKSFNNQGNSANLHRDFVIENDTNLYLTGLYGGLNDFNPEENELILPYEVLNCTYIVCLNAQNGIFKWARNTQGAPQSTVYVQAITSNSSNNTISLTGFIYDSVDLNPGSGISQHASSPESLGDIFILNMGLCDIPINIIINDSICEGGGYLFADDLLTSQGIYSRTFPSFNGCDSTVTLNLSTKAHPEQPSTPCYQTATFNSQTCSWVLTGTQPTQPPTACYQTATFNNQTCAWDLSGTQPTQPETACYQTATFNNQTCAWELSGTQPTQPETACYQTATFNNQTCAWELSGTQPTQPSTACYQTATFNNQTCAWYLSGTQPTQPETACYQTATFNNQTCAWELTGSPNTLAVTTASACSTYVWTVNGQSYTTSNTYTYFANCQDYQLNLTINPIPTVTFEPDNTTYCNNSGSVDLSGGSPAGGVYSGPGVSNGAFNPALAGSGLHPVTYSYTNANGCSSSATVTYEVAVCTGVEAAAGITLELRPNPIDNFIYIELQPSQPSENYKLELLDAAGRLVHTCEVGLGDDAVRVQLPEIAPGMYVLSLRGKERSFVRRVVR